jgi:hypothetical protein
MRRAKKINLVESVTRWHSDDSMSQAVIGALSLVIVLLIEQRMTNDQ